MVTPVVIHSYIPVTLEVVIHSKRHKILIFFGVSSPRTLNYKR